jgi:hypothetical protein
MAPPPAVPPAAGVVVTGPNHAVHGILTLFTFWLCGGWAWIWLIVAMANNKRVQTVDAYGNVLARPLQPRTPRSPNAGSVMADRAKQFVAEANEDPMLWVVAAVIAVIVIGLVVLFAVIA